MDEPTSSDLIRDLVRELTRLDHLRIVVAGRVHQSRIYRQRLEAIGRSLLVDQVEDLLFLRLECCLRGRKRRGQNEPGNHGHGQAKNPSRGQKCHLDLAF